MNKVMVGSASLLAIVMGSMICVQNRPAIASTPDIENPYIIRETPPPIFSGNSQLPQSSRISREQILSNRVSPDPAMNLSLELTTYGSYAASPKGGGVDFPAVSPARQVWVVKEEYAEYEHLRLGLMRNAKITSVIDAETGESLGYQIVGTPLENVGHPSLDGVLVVPF